MIKYTINYREKIFEHPELSKIMGVWTYETLHLLHNEIVSNAMEDHSNLGGRQHVYLGLVDSLTDFLSSTTLPYFVKYTQDKSSSI